MLDGTSSETELLQASIRGDASAFEVIVGNYQSLVCAITFSATANLDKSEELAHEAFIRAWTSLDQLQDLAKFRAWLCAIARNIVRNYIRDEKRDVVGRAASLDKMSDISSGTSEPVDMVIDKEQQAAIRRALEQIPEGYCEPLILFYREQRSLKQVARQLELSEEAARTRVSRGRKLQQVAAMVEDAIGQTGPSKAFTAGVVASIAGMAIKGTGVATAVGLGAAMSTTGTTAIIKTVTSGMTAKIIAAAAVAVIGVGVAVTYKQITEPDVPAVWKTVQDRQEDKGNDTEETAELAQIVAAQTLVDEIAGSKIEISDAAASAPNGLELAESPDDDPNTAESNTGISGVVVDKRTSEPIKGAQVFFRLSGQTRSAISDPNGHFRLVGVQPDENRHVYVIAKNYASRHIVLQIVRKKIIQGLKVELAEGAAVTGVVRDEKGKPVSGAGASVSTSIFTIDRVITGADGKFEIAGLDPAFGGYSLRVSHPNYPPVSTSFPAPKARQTLSVDVVLEPGATVHGRVTDPRGNWVASVLVGGTTSRARSDAEGLYELKNVPVGELALWAVADKYAPYVERLSLEDPRADKLVNIQLSDSQPLRGKIIDVR